MMVRLEVCGFAKTIVLRSIGYEYRSLSVSVLVRVGPKVDFTKAIISHSEANGCAIEYSSCSSVVCSSAMLEIVDGFETTAKVVFLVLIDFF